MKILALGASSGEEEAASSQERTGLFTSGIVATRQGQRIVMFFTGRKHAGENLARVLASGPKDWRRPFRCVTPCRATCRSCRKSWKSSWETVTLMRGAALSR